MSSLEFTDLRHCPLCERTVRGGRCPVDGTLAVDEEALFADDGLVSQTVLGRYRVEHRVPGGGGGALYAVSVAAAVDEAEQSSDLDAIVELTAAPTPERALLRILAVTEEESFGVADRFAKVFSTLFSAAPHPALPAVTKYGREPKLGLYVVSKRGEGRSLEALLAEERHFSSERSVAIALRLVDALETLHEHGIVHRDLCAFRVRIGEPDEAGSDGDDVNVVLTDAGLFDVLADRPGLAQPTDGSRHYADPRTMSPEIAAGYSADPRSDIYSLGVLLAVMLVGRYPHDGTDPIEIVRAHIREPFPEATLAPLPEDLKRLVLKMCAKSPDDRFQTASEVKSALHDFLDLFRMIGHDTDPELFVGKAIAEAVDSYDQLVTIGGDEDDAGAALGQSPVLDSPSVMLDTTNTTALVERAVPRRADGKNNLLVGIALSLFLIVIALVAVPFLSDTERSGRDRKKTANIAALTTVADGADVRAALASDAPEPSRAGAKESVKAPRAIDVRPAGAVASGAPPASPKGAVPLTGVVAKEGLADGVPDGQPMLLEIRSIPSRAQVLRNGYVIGETPMQLSLQSRKTFMLQLKKPGYMASAVEVLPGDQPLVEVSLKPLEAKGSAKKRGLVKTRAPAKPVAKPVAAKPSVAKPSAAGTKSPTKASVKAPAKKVSAKKAPKKKATAKKTSPEKTPAKKPSPAKTDGDYDLF